MAGDSFESDSEFLLLAKVDRAIELVLADLHRTSSRRPSISADIFGGQVRITVEGGYNEPSIDSHYGSQTEIVRDVAEYLQHRLSENLRVWPECATHSTGLHADLFDDSAVWRCRFGEHSVAAIGHLELAREGARMVDEIFGNRRLAAIYDALDPDRSDLLHYLAIVREFSARTVLDVGCGTGVFALMLAEHGIDVTGVDPADASLEVARAQPGTDVVRWILGDATTLPLVSFRNSYRFDSGELMTSDSTLRFRDRDEVTLDLATARFRVDVVREATDRPGREFDFIARRHGRTESRELRR